MHMETSSISVCSADKLGKELNHSMYSVLFFDSPCRVNVDMAEYHLNKKSIVFLAPYQQFSIAGVAKDLSIVLLQFHGDFYCIEYHRVDVSCNGLLFNNMYSNPLITPSTNEYVEIKSVVIKIEEKQRVGASHSDEIVKSYIQLILALCSRIKRQQNNVENIEEHDAIALQFKYLLEQNYIRERKADFYASAIGISTKTLNKKIKDLFHRTPLQLINERTILEAKKLLHLSYKSVKEIAAQLNFNDEFYFSRYFKKAIGLSPKQYRAKVGISIAAQKSM